MRGKIGSLTGTMAAGENIIETLAEKERSATKKYTNSPRFFNRPEIVILEVE